MADQTSPSAAAARPARDPLQDHLLTPQNAALIIIDYQPSQVTSVASMDRRELVTNIGVVVEIAKLFHLPIVLSTIKVKTGSAPTIPELQAALPGIEAIDRTSMNAWEDPLFRQAVEATGRKKLIMTALWTEVCLAFPTLDALRAGYDVYPVVDAIGGTTLKAHDTALSRVEQAGARLVTWVEMLCELQRDWARTETATQFWDILSKVEGH